MPVRLDTDLSFLARLGVDGVHLPGTSTGRHSLDPATGPDDPATLRSSTPVDGSLIATVSSTNRAQYDHVVERAEAAFRVWREVPAPRRGEIVRQIGDELRAHKDDLGRLVAYEMGKIVEEGKGEVQEMIDICDFAVGQSRMLYGKTMPSERPEHRLYEQWHPLGPVAVITAFNFPVAVWAWNAMLAAVCGDVIIWKPSEKTPLCAVAVQRIVARVLERNDLPEGIFSVIQGGRQVGEFLTTDPRIPLVSATGSIPMGREVGRTVAGRLGRTLLELGGNNAIIVSDRADLDLAVRAIVFGAAGTAGQRCTSTRRLFVHEAVFDELKDRLIRAYAGLRIGSPLDPETLVGPLVDAEAAAAMQAALREVREAGGEVLFGGEILEGEGFEGGNYVRPAICLAENHMPIVQEETFAPILYLMRYRELDEAIALQNGVRQGLSSSIFTNDLREAEAFLSARGSDCGIANVNIGTSGAEIGGAFGGEKETGGGRESGSDSWKAYMRRQTNTINWGRTLPLAQGIEFDV
ncbi:MAG: aldehyde dehydrogenase family protein [Gemmatimonadales bacterium]|nr:MAG: aldehyde dehydrogenase family protein [Gemmatimonadales bacterium]